LSFKSLARQKKSAVGLSKAKQAQILQLIGLHLPFEKRQKPNHVKPIQIRLDPKVYGAAACTGVHFHAKACFI
jgi:hypothetical protein|tara:strand:- start:100 stop:318 length:219 start_codon:yes stop_codon:yes gene_type:complete